MSNLKTHVRKGTGNGCDDIPLCVFNNGRRAQYHHLSTHAVVSPKEFRKSDNRCQLCEAAYLYERNKQRKVKGLPLVSTWNEGLD